MLNWNILTQSQLNRLPVRPFNAQAWAWKNFTYRHPVTGSPLTRMMAYNLIKSGFKPVLEMRRRPMEAKWDFEKGRFVAVEA